ncbi:unnamed protein product [Sphagnum troendelagicum]|uniref:Uncharacterized protein n=1 Tax=Sphagnum troendelagicum TaxID=128251 RepID=A0ABP0U1B5_9BRYO
MLLHARNVLLMMALIYFLVYHVTHGRVMAMLDADFHSLNPVHVQYYGPAMDKIKCQILEGVEAADVQVLVLDMQGWSLLDMLGVE